MSWQLKDIDRSDAGYPEDIAYGFGELLVTLNSGLPTTSGDLGATWEAVSSNPWDPHEPKALFSGEGFMLAGGFQRILRTTDGESWAVVLTITAANPVSRGFAVKGSRIVSAMGVYAPYSDDEGATWTSVGLDNISSCIAATENGFVIGTEANGIYTNATGEGTWTARTSPFDDVSAIAYNGTALVAVGTGKVATSTNDGETWTERTIDLDEGNEYPYDVDSDGDMFMLVASNGRVFTSDDDGVTWVEDETSPFASNKELVMVRYLLGAWFVGGESVDLGVESPQFGIFGTPSGLAEDEDISDEAEAESTMSADTIGFAVEMISSASAASTLSPQAVFLATMNSAAGAESIALVTLVRTATLNSAASAQSVSATQELLNALMFSVVSANSTQPLEEQNPTVWVLNAETFGSTRYENYPFNSFAKIGDAYYGAKADGIYKLEGPDDAGSPVQAMVSLGKRGFGSSSLKRVPYCYIGVASSGRMFLKVLVDDREYLYASRGADERLRTQRVDIGRGLCANYLEFELYNADGDDFELSSVEFSVIALNRRI